MNRAKVLEFFDAEKVQKQVHIIGVGAVGSNVAVNLARMGFEEINIWDMDTVDAHNITNQMYKDTQIGKEKVDACEENILEINPECKVIKHNKGLQDPYILNGIVFLCVDNIDLRRKIVEENIGNPYCTCMADFRMRLTDAQFYFADWSQEKQKEKFLKTMQFSHDEAKAATPQSACHVELSVIYNVNIIVSLGIANVTKWILGQKDFKTMILTDCNIMAVDAI